MEGVALRRLRKERAPAFAQATARRARSSPLHLPTRKRPAHFPAVEGANHSTMIFATVCVRNRRLLLANDVAAKLIVSAWRAGNFWLVGRYVIMRDHIHLFCTPNRFPTTPLGQWIQFWRNLVTRHWPARDQAPIWQREYWDTQLRGGESYTEKWSYVMNHPVRHGYVGRAEDWPYQGELNVLHWDV
jgi:REP element-mobilizing transposase RayT